MGIETFCQSWCFDVLSYTTNKLTDEEKLLGIDASTVISVCKPTKIPEVLECFCDTWFTSLKLFIYLKEKFEIFNQGIIRPNRIGE